VSERKGKKSRERPRTTKLKEFGEHSTKPRGIIKVTNGEIGKKASKSIRLGGDIDLKSPGFRRQNRETRTAGPYVGEEKRGQLRKPKHPRTLRAWDPPS